MAYDNNRNGIAKATKINDEVFEVFRGEAMAARKLVELCLPESMRSLKVADRFLRVGLANVYNRPELWDASPESFVQAIKDAASVGIEPSSGMMSEGYLVPRRLKGVPSMVFQLGYQGLIALARRAGHLRHCYAVIVFPEDHYVYREGLDAALDHIPSTDGARDIDTYVACYCISIFKDGYKTATWMWRNDIDKRRDASPASKRDDAIWKKWPDEMVKKTVIRYAAKQWPKSVEITAAIDREDREHIGERSADDITLDGATIRTAALPPKAAQPMPPASTSQAKAFVGKLAAKIVPPAPAPVIKGQPTQFDAGDYDDEPPHPGDTHELPVTDR